MAVRIIHFGSDQCLHLAVLSSAGYQVEDCGTSLPSLVDRLQRNDFDLIAVSADDSVASAVVAETARSHGCHSLVLFPGTSNTYNSSQFDLVIPSLTPPQEWLEKVADLIEKTRATLSQSARLRQECAASRQESAEVRAQCAHERGRANLNWEAVAKIRETLNNPE